MNSPLKVTSMDNVIKHIYKSCDPNNTDSVPASSLVDFVKPYMPDNLNELHELKAQLDPGNSNPNINSAFFYSVMSDWIVKIKEQDLNNSFSEMSMNLGGAAQTDASPILSIFTAGVSPNMSRISNVSNINNNTISIDNITLQEQVQKLQYQLHKTANELDLVKQQLAVAEEQNELFSADLKKLEKLQNRDQQITEEFNKNKLESDEIREEANVANKKIQHLEKLLSNHEKQHRIVLSQINQLENENSYLKSKIQKYEKTKLEGRKSINEIKDELDIKETEISTLMEIINELKSNLDEKTELVKFYTNENNLLKQKALALENLLHDIFPEDVSSLKSQGDQSFKVFNTPKLLHQLANPISPNFSTPSLAKCKTSSPIKSVNSCCELFTNVGIVTVLRSPHKTLKEELLEMPDDKNPDEEIKRLQDVLKEQEMIKNSLWDNIKYLSCDNEALQEYRKGYEELIYNVQEKNEVIQRLKTELETSEANLNQQKRLSSFNVSKELNFSKENKSTETYVVPRENKGTETEKDEVIQRLKSELNQQKMLLADLSESLEIEKNKNSDVESKSAETNIWQKKHELIQRLRNDLKSIEVSFHHKKLLNVNLHKKYEKTLVDKSTETDKNLWSMQIPTTEVVESKRTSYAKQQMKMERLLEKQEKVEKELTNERGINTTLSLKLQELRKENKQMSEDLEFHREKTSKQTDIIKTLLNEKRNLEENVGVLEMENKSLQKENLELKEEKRALTNEKYNLTQNLQNSLSRLAIEASITNSLRAENELLVNKQRQLELKLKDECIRQIHMKKQIIDLKTTNSLKIIELEKNLAEKEVLNIEIFLDVNNRELKRTTSGILSSFRKQFENELDLELLREMENLRKTTKFDLEKEMVMLNSNVKLAVQLLEIMAEKCSSLLQDSVKETQLVDQTYDVRSPSPNTSIDDFYDSHTEFQENSTDGSDSFMSCISNISINVNECLDITSLESDSFLDSLNFNDEDLKELSKEEVKEKFATLALTLTVHFTTSKKRYLDQKEKCNRLLLKFFTYLNYSTDLLRRLDSSEQSGIYKTAITYLQLLKNISEDVFKSAVQCGVLQYENRTMNRWKLVINYVAVLSQDNKQIKESQDFDKSEDSKSKAPVPLHDTRVECAAKPPPPLKSTFLKKVKFFLCLLLLVMFVLFIMLVLYVDHLCSKDGRRICPLEWILSFFVKRIHSHHLL